MCFKIAQCFTDHRNSLIAFYATLCMMNHICDLVEYARRYHVKVATSRLASRLWMVATDRSTVQNPYTVVLRLVAIGEATSR